MPLFRGRRVPSPAVPSKARRNSNPRMATLPEGHSDATNAPRHLYHSLSHLELARDCLYSGPCGQLRRASVSPHSCREMDPEHADNPASCRRVVPDESDGLPGCVEEAHLKWQGQPAWLGTGRPPI